MRRPDEGQTLEGIRSCQGSQTFPDIPRLNGMRQKLEKYRMEPSWTQLNLLFRQCYSLAKKPLSWCLWVSCMFLSSKLSPHLYHCLCPCYYFLWGALQLEDIGGIWNSLDKFDLPSLSWPRLSQIQYVFPRLCIALRRLGLGLDSFPFVFRCLS